VSKGVCYIAYGTPALREVGRSIKSLREVSDLPVALICEDQTDYRGIQHIPFEDRSFGARRVKVMLDLLTPYDHTMYLDADTRVQSGIISQGFEILEAGWDIVIVPSANQGSKVFAHIEPEERQYTSESLENTLPLQLQAGVMWFAKTRRTADLFSSWRKEWLRFKKHDQAALVRALDKTACRIWLLSLAWNSRRGKIIDHRFGKAVR